MTDRDHQLRRVEVGDDPAAWRAAGFTVDETRVAIGNTVVDLVGGDGGRGIRAVAVDGIDREIDGLAFAASHDAEAPDPLPAPAHRNQVTSFDHLVAMSPHMDRTTTSLESAGLELRRTRTFGPADDLRRQAFFWLGDVILEVAGSDTAAGEGAATLWGLALTSTDLDRAAAELGDAMSAPRDAVQKGRRIATIRTRELDISVPIALMTPHARTTV